MKNKILTSLGLLTMSILLLPFLPKPVYANIIPSSPGEGLLLMAYFLSPTIIAEFIPILLFTVLYKLPKRFIFSAIGVNFISWPIATILARPLYIYALLTHNSFLPYTLVLEISITLFEGLFIYLISRQFLTFKKSLFISFVMNLTSITAGLIIRYFRI